MNSTKTIKIKHRREYNVVSFSKRNILLKKLISYFQTRVKNNYLKNQVDFGTMKFTEHQTFSIFVIISFLFFANFLSKTHLIMLNRHEKSYFL